MIQETYSNGSKDEIFDFLCIGTSIIISLEAIYQKKLGKSVIMIDESSVFGGAWKSIEIDGIKNVENAIHYLTPNTEGIRFLKEKLNLSIEQSKGKFQYFRIFGNFYIRFLYGSLIARLLDAVCRLETHGGFITKVKYLSKSIKKIIKKPKIASYYLAGGSSEITNFLKNKIKKNKVIVKLNLRINKIFFDLQKRKVLCELSNGEKIFCKSLILGHGAKLPEININNSILVLDEKFYPRPAYHLVVKDDKLTDTFEAILTKDNLIKYVHNITRFSSIQNKKKDKIKIFVFALQSHVIDNHLLSEKLLKKLKEIGLVEKNAQIKKSLFSDIILPTLHDEDLYTLKKKVGNLVSIFRTENLANGISYYYKRWKNLL